MEESVRIVVLDFYMSPPIAGLDVTYSEFRGASVNQVPILRCFGSTKSGEKICVHIHGVFPYLYIPYDGVGNAQGLMYQIAASIDKAVNTSLNQGSSSTQHVYKISLVSGIPMYGYHPKKHQFFKIYLYNPMLVSTVTNLLLNHSILDKIFQPHEAHINFTLQFMIDYNLHGMSNMIISDVKYRVDPEKPNTNIDKELFLPASIDKITTCELEADINAENIFNRQEIINGNLAVNPGIAALWADEKQRRRNKNEDSQLDQFLELKNMNFTPTKTHLIFQQALAERLAVLSTDKEVPKENLNISVYPAETPNNASIQNASLIDIHTPSSLELSLDDTMNISSSQNLDSTLTSTQGNLNMTMDEDANNFVQLLQKLAEENLTENAKEDDSILSQTLKEDEPIDELNEDFLDLSIPFAAVTTPRKVDTKIISDESEDKEENYFETTLIPQIDGQTEMSDSSDEPIIVRKTRSEWQGCHCGTQKDSNSSNGWTVIAKDEKPLEKTCCGKSMPPLDMNFLPSDFSASIKVPLNKLNMTPIVKLHRTPIMKIECQVMSKMFKVLDDPRTKQWTRKTPEKKIEECLRLIRLRINRINNKTKIKRIGNIVYKKEVIIGTLLKKFLKPKFNIIPGRKWFLESHPKDATNNPIISRILLQTHNYTDPTLHLLVKHSRNKHFLYNYGGKPFPDITEIPFNISESECQKILLDIRKSSNPINRKMDSIKRQKIKILHDKILNIRKPKNPVQENKLDIQGKTDIKEEPPCEIAFPTSPNSQKIFEVKQESPSKTSCTRKEKILTKFETELRDEFKQANITLQKHIQQLKDFDIYKACAKQEQIFVLQEKYSIFSHLKCLNNNFETNVNKAQTSTFSYQTGDTCELPSSEEVNNVLGEIRHLKNAVSMYGSDSSRTECHLRISNDHFDARGSYNNDVITLTRFSESQKHEEFKGPCNKESDLISPKILSDIGNKNCEIIHNFESSQYNKNNPKMKIHRQLNHHIDSSTNESANNYDTLIEDRNNLSCSPSSRLIKSENIPVACNLTICDRHSKFVPNVSTPSTDSDYMSISTSSLERNISYGFEYEFSPSIKSVVNSKELPMRQNNLLESPKASPQFNIISDIIPKRHLHVQCLQHSASNPLSESKESSFENGADDGMEISNIIQQYKAKPKPWWDHTYTQPYSSQTPKKIRLSTPNMYINCDGAVDSSSDDEESTRRSKKHAKRNRTRSQYAPLQIFVNKSPRVPGNPLEAGLADNMAGMTGDQADFHETSSEVDQKRSLSKSCISFKRKLNFEGGGSLNITTAEEFLSCAYSPNHLSKPSKTTVNNTTIKLSEQSDVLRTEIADTDVDSNNDNSQSPNDSTPQNLETANSDSDLFSESEDMNKSFFRSYQLSISEKYDRETKYKAKEGCSTVFTPNSFVSNSTLLSKKKLNSQVLSDNTSTDITPYQEPEHVKTNFNNIVINENNQSVQSSENLNSDIPPYQKLKQLDNDKRQIKLSSSVNLKVLKPAFCAPTRLQIETSLNELKIAEINVKEPFYSNVEDYTGGIEIGHNTLRIPSESSCHLPDFDSDFDNLIKYRKYFTENVANLIWNSNNLKNLKLSHCTNRNIIIRPIKKSPSVKVVQEWLEENSKEKKLPLTPDGKNMRSRIYIPYSPGRDQDDLELSLSVTPCTPTSRTTLTQSSKRETPKPSLHSQSLSPILDHRKKKCRKKNLINSKPFSLRESLLSTEEINKSCQITGISQNNSFGFNKSVQNLQAVRVVLEHQNLTTMVMELHIRTRGDFKPDPEYDPICAIFYSVLNDVPETNPKKCKARGVVALHYLPINMGIPNKNLLDGICIDCDIIYEVNEKALINKFLSLINYWDPDIFAGYEIQMLSWGYLIDRAFVLSINIIPLLGRSQINKYGRAKQKNTNYEIETAITGRIILDVWRIMRHEIALQSYTFESIVYHILHKRVPMFAFKDLTFWWDHRTNLFRHRVVSYYLLRVETILELFDKLDFLNRTSELARLFGILFYEVLSRGSQFRVESMMLRLAKPLNYVPVSPSTAQRAKMKAPEYIALVMEPESKLYTDPVIVLDFQSLYPSIIIAYNYCFTTCVGRVNCLGTNSSYEFGASQLKIPRKVVEKLSKRNFLNFSPCGVAYVKQKVRQGILPRMLTEILDTRLMVKNSMKENKGNENLQKVLHNRQLGLKLIANVTYGYTAANFSGRMCCVEVGDSVVSKARETLQRAIALVEKTAEWGARVVYGDTDSLFVLVPGKSKETAFEVGKKIADAITADNPDPVKLKLEKVYQPCILQTKKRYVGYMYETPDQKEPVYDAKGIETVRRDGCPVVSKMLQKCLTVLFETKDVSLVKKYILRQFNKIQAGRASIQDLTFAKEYRGASGYKPGACVPALELARKWTAVDRRSEPRSGERVPYIIVNGPPGLPLIRLVRSPKELLNDSSLRPNSLYYITKVIIPPINRCFNLIGADLHTWFNQMPRRNTQYLPNSSPIVKSTISQYFVSKICASCSQPTQNGLCDRCCQNVNVTAFTLVEKLRKWEENFYNTKLICHSCTGHLNEISCISLDCPVLYRRTQTNNDLQQSTYVRELLSSTDIFSENSVFDD